MTSNLKRVSCYLVDSFEISGLCNEMAKIAHEY